MTDSAPIYDNKAHVRGKLDLRDAVWQRPPGPPSEGGDAEIAEVEHTDGATYIAMRNSLHPESVLVFTMSEWEAFLAGARDGEFNEPW
ncbi:DUF397 domain-containing protein [Nocardia sp. NRRL S-836]|uniref:DUF397 domain-containing protein n=1 Tax=Nocardia sp. NRRL S-836 TaxID=1519492 RepID=UPI0006B06576|nr:DUF397 domain-containing protein [Nocardia sp. NRRL S-836]KOV81096.1 hypothetical protein ADL03_30295 [Nocardia sp. NRRL S-836]